MKRSGKYLFITNGFFGNRFTFGNTIEEATKGQKTTFKSELPVHDWILLKVSDGKIVYCDRAGRKVK